jgi:uridine kinase
VPEDALDEVVAMVAARSESVTVVAVDGHSAAGKSMFAGSLAERMPASVVAGDDFYRVMDEDERAALTPAEGAAWYYDWERLRDQALLPLRNRRPAVFRPYDWAVNDLADRLITIAPEPLIIIEGLFVSRPELAHVVDIAVLVVADAGSRGRRQVDRADASEEWLERWDAAERWYFEHRRPPSSFDVITRPASHRTGGWGQVAVE